MIAPQLIAWPIRAMGRPLILALEAPLTTVPFPWIGQECR